MTFVVPSFPSVEIILAAGNAGPRIPWKQVATSAGLFLAALVCLSLRIGRVPVVYDEGLVLVAADRFLQGSVPYKDFWNTHPPGQIWVVAALFRVFGESMMVMRVYDVIVKACLAMVVFAWAVRLSPRWVALAAFAGAVLWLEHYGLFGYTAFPALLLGLIALGLAAGGLQHAPVPRAMPLAAGLVAGTAALFRLDFGVYVAATIVTLTAGVSGLGHRTSAGARIWEMAVGMGTFAAGLVVLPLAAVLGLLAQGVPASKLFATVVTYPVTMFPEVRGMPMPGLSAKTLIYYVPSWIGLAGLAYGLRLVWRRRRADPTAIAWCALSLLLLWSLPQARTRVDHIHQLPVLLPSLALAAGLWFRLWHRGGGLRAAAGFLALAIGLTYLAVPVGTLLRAQPVVSTLAHGLPRAAGVALETDQVAAIRSVQERTGPGDAVYVGVGRHDRAWYNDALFYFLAGRRYATAYHNLLPGLVTRAGVQQEMIAQLRASSPRCIVLCTRFDALVEPNASSRPGSRMLDDYVRQAYALSGAMGNYQIWTRR